MATPVARAQSIVDALKNAVVPTAVADRVLDAFAAQYATLLPEGVTPATATRGQKAVVFVRAVRQFTFATVEAFEATRDAEAAALAARTKAAAEIDLGAG